MVFLKSESGSHNLVNDLLKLGALTSKPFAFQARSWELKSIASIDIFDGFGSDILFNYRDRHILRVIPRSTNSFIPDKIRFFYDGLKYQRLHYPYLRINGRLVSVSWKDIAFFFFLFLRLQTTLHSLNVQTAIYPGFPLDSESILKLKQLFYSALNPFFLTYQSNINIDNFDFRSFFLLNVKKMMNADLIVFLGVNLRLENPILHVQLRQRSLTDLNLKILCLGSTKAFNFFTRGIGLSTQILMRLLSGKHRICNIVLQCKQTAFVFGSDFHYPHHRITNFFSKILLLLNKTPSFHFLVSSVTDVNQAEIGLKKSYSKINSFLKTDLSINFFTTACEMSSYARFLSNSNAFSVFQGSNYNNVINYSDIILPSASFIEKNGLYLTMEGYVKEASRVYLPSKQAKHDLHIFSFLAELNFDMTLDFICDLLKDQFLVKQLCYINMEGMQSFKRNDALIDFSSIGVGNITHVRQALSDFFIFPAWNIKKSLDFPFLNFYEQIWSNTVYNRNLWTKMQFNNAIFRRKQKKYYGLDALTQASPILMVRSNLEDNTFRNF